ncbi:Plastid movement impaired 1-related [Thalictrum thalictroides]|uniref:Plastid movement impaired 1-related n=1 Tax=Thalictrum thalictroides TaxID=46969 RepID=A0A7J6W3M3_THATH|nr:Plastid movement impaired 1-related [Thalictrum thalictroides]
MLSKADSKKKNFGDGTLLQEIEALGQALYLNRNSSSRLVSTSDIRSKSVGKTYPESKSKSKIVKEESSQKDKKSSIWNWKPLKAFSHIRNRRFNCCFSLQVHSVEGLPPNFSDVSLCVHWKRRDGMLQTRPTKVFQGMADFEETLTYKCSVYGSGNGPHHSAKYEAKHCLLYALVVSAPDLDLGKHRVDLTRLLPLTLEELLEEKKSGKWTTSFNLSGKAKGATLNVSFGFSIIGDDAVESPSNRSAPVTTSSKLNRLNTTKSITTFDKGSTRNPIRRTESLSGYPSQGYSNQRSRANSRSVDVKILHEVLPTAKSELSSSMSVLYQKLDEGEMDSPTYSKPEFEAFSEPVEPLKPKSEVEAFSEYTEPLKPKSEVEVFSEYTKPLKPKAEYETLSECVEPLKPTSEFEVYSEHVEPLKPKPDTEDLCEHVEPLEPESISWSEPEKDNLANEGDETDFTVIEQGVEMSTKELVNVEDEAANVGDDSVVLTAELDKNNGCDMVLLQVNTKPDFVDEYANCAEKVCTSEENWKENTLFTDESAIEELDTAFQEFLNSDSAGFDSPQAKAELSGQGTYMEVKSNYKAKVGKSLSLDAASESVASEFLNMLGIEHSPFGLSSDSDPESPRERLLRQFEKESLYGGSIFDFDIGKEEMVEYDYNAPNGSRSENQFEDFELSSIVHVAETEHQRAAEMMKSKARAKMLEDLETEALMQEWGLNEKAFQNSPPNGAGGFGSPIHLPPEKPLELPPLGEGLGPFVQTKDGGFLRSMSPSLFRNAKHSENLVMQVSSPVVVPAEMGSGIMEILQGLASVGIEKLSMQANKLMPLEDITGKTMQQVAWEATPSLEAPEREVLMQHEAEVGNPRSDRKRRKGSSSGSRPAHLNSSSLSRDSVSEYVSVEDLAPLAMDKIEALSMEGLRIQSGMSDEDAPSNISPQAFGEVSALQGKRTNMSGSLGMEGSGGLQLLDIKDTGDDVDGLMGLSITLDEWMRLDDGIVDEDDQNSERTSKILQLIMLPVERVFGPPKPKIYSNIFKRRNDEEDGETELSMADEKENNIIEEKKEEEESITQFKITEVHVVGLNSDPGKKEALGYCEAATVWAQLVACHWYG